MRWWMVAAAAALVVLWWWRKQAQAALNGTLRTVSAPPESGTLGVQASLLAKPNPPPVAGVPATALPPAANKGNEGVHTFASAFAVNSPREPAPSTPPKKPPATASTGTKCPPGTKRAYQGTRPVCVPK